MQTGIIQDYINVGQFTDTLFGMYRDARESWRDDANGEFLDLEYDDETLREIASCVANDLNKDMKEYLHQDDHRMVGNFANVLDDYVYYRTGTYGCDKFGRGIDRKIFDAMVERLDAGVESPRADDDRNYLSSWIFKAFGTYGLMYNFSGMIADALYYHEKENAVS